MRVFVDGCFDIFHYGHANALQHAFQMASSLVVGVVADEYIAQYKAPPVMTLEERCVMVESVKWADDVLEGIPHTIDDEFTASLVKDHGIQMVVHGDDDTTMPDGTDGYAGPKNAGIFWAFPRTPGISTTDLVRALLTHTSIPPSRLPLMIPAWTPRPDTVYVDGAFDCFHVGHVSFLKKARIYGVHIVVGVHSDETVTRRRGSAPILCASDRARSLLHCKYVDGIVMDAPEMLTLKFLDRIGAACVARGAIHETTRSDAKRYGGVMPKLVGIYSPSDMTVATLRGRVRANAAAYAHKIDKIERHEL